MLAPRMAPMVALLVVVGAGTTSLLCTACSDGTTPVCDDAGSCLIVPPSQEGDAAPEAAGPDDAPDDSPDGQADGSAE